MSIFGAEAIGTALLILLGDGVVAAVLLSKSKAENSGWIVITWGWAMGVMVGVFAVAQFSGAHLNPAVTFGFVLLGNIDWSDVPKYLLGECTPQPGRDVRVRSDMPSDREHGVQRGRGLLEDHRRTGTTQFAQALGADRDDVVGAEDTAPPARWRCRGSAPRIVRAVTVLPLPDSPTMASTSPGCTCRLRVAHRVHVATVGGERDIQVLDVDGRLGAVDRLGHQSTSPISSRATGWEAATASAGVAFLARRRVRRRGSARSLRLSPMSVTPSTSSTIAHPGKIEVHQMPLVTSLIERFRS